MNLRIAQRLIIAFSMILMIMMGVTWASNGVENVKINKALLQPKTKKLNVLNAVLQKEPTIIKMQLVSDAPKVDPTTTSTTTTTTTTVIPATTEVTTTTQPVVASSETSGNSAIWDCIIFHESRGNPTAVNSTSGAGGLFQFLPSSWLGYGGGKYASSAQYATVTEQWDIAIHAQSESGWYPWHGDGCTPIG